MRAGDLDRRLTIKRPTQTGASSLNEAIYTWSDVITVWAQKIHKAESEHLAAEQRFAERVVSFRIRWFDDIRETDIAVCEGVEYDIRGTRELGRREGVELSCIARPTPQIDDETEEEP